MGLNLARVEKRRAKFIFWDVGGQPVLRKIWEKYYSQCNCVVFVIDGADESRLNEVKQTLEKLYSKSLPTELVDLPVLFLLNKADQEGFLGQDRLTRHLGLDALNCRKDVEVKKMSASSKEGIEASITWLYENTPSQ